MKCALYCRVSTTDQDCSMQLSSLRDYCQRQGWEIVAEFVDNGVSGRKASRPELDKMMAAARRKEFDTILCWRLDRMMRSVRHLSALLADLDLWGVSLLSITQPIDTRDKVMGRLITTILSAVAEYEVDTIRERVKAGLAEAKRKGVKLGRASTLDNDTRGRILQMRAEGVKIRTIAEQLGTVSRETVRRVINAG